jgi:hypothetical protein
MAAAAFSIIGGLMGMGGGGPAEQALTLHDGQITVAIDSANCMVIMQIDEKKDSQPIIFDLLNNTISNVTVYPPLNTGAPTSGTVM